MEWSRTLRIVLGLPRAFGCGVPALAAGLTLCLPASARQSFEVLVTEAGGVPRTRQAAAFSAPLPKGAVRDVGQVRVLDGDEEMAANVRALDNWPDGSIRWVRVEMVVDEIPAGVRREYRVEFGPDVRRQATQAMSVQEAHGKVTVENGLLQVVIGSRGIERLVLKGKLLARGDAVRIVDAAGKVYDGWAGRPKVNVKRRGPAAVEIDVAGASAPPFNFRSRYTIYRGCPVIRRQTYIESAKQVDVQLVAVNGLRAAEGMDRVTVLGREPLPVRKRPGMAMYWHMTAPNPETWVLAEVGQNGQATVRAQFQSKTKEDPRTGAPGERPGYFIDLSGEDRGLTLACELRQWGRDADASCAVVDGALELAINAHGMWPQHKGQIYQRHWRWYEGVAKNFETFILAHEGAYSDEVRDAAFGAYAPLYAMPDPGYVRKTNVFGTSLDRLEFEWALAPIRRWVGLAQVTIAEYEKLKAPKRAEGIGGLVSGEIYRTISSKTGTGGDLNRAMNDTRHWFAEALRKGDGALLRDTVEIAYAEMDHGMYHVGNPKRVGLNHYHGRWSGLGGGAYGCRSFACELPYIASGDDYFLDAWKLELGAQAKAKGWGARSGGYSMVNFVWAYRRFRDEKYLAKANEVFAYLAARQRPDGAVTQGLREASPLKPWMMGIAMEGVLELHGLDPSDKKLGFLTRMADRLLKHQMPDGVWLYVVAGRKKDAWKQGAGTATVAPALIRLYDITKDARYLASAQRALVWLLNTRDTKTDILRARHGVGNNPSGQPGHTTCSYIFSLCARMSDVCRRAGLPFLIDVPTGVSERESWGVSAITHLAPGAISFETAAPADRGESPVKVGGFGSEAVLVLEVNETAREIRADRRGVVAFTVEASGRRAVAVREKQ